MPENKKSYKSDDIKMYPLLMFNKIVFESSSVTPVTFLKGILLKE